MGFFSGTQHRLYVKVNTNIFVCVCVYICINIYTRGSVLEKMHEFNSHTSSEVAVSRQRLLSGALRKELTHSKKPARLWGKRKQNLGCYGPCFCRWVKAPSAEDCVRLKQTWKDNKDLKFRDISCRALCSTMLVYVQWILDCWHLAEVWFIIWLQIHYCSFIF